ncbi:helix-turn-helix domain-containing protein [Luteimonas lutimaris]|uniref:Helix-turn-helix domain-containing protein n=1 Tax=Luteimonas lutimaris TaxID=698645 RepID=A0ABP7MV04_9GAMM
MAANQKLSYTIPEAVAATGCTRTRLYGAIADGALRSIKDGRRRLIPAKALEEFIAKLERESAGRAA